MYSAEITTEIGRETRLVITLKLTDVTPAGTLMLVGTATTFGLLLKRLITAPPEGAGALSVTVPVDVNPPLTLAGLRVSVLSVGSGMGVVAGVDVGTNVGSAVTVVVIVAIAVGVSVGCGDPAPIHNVAFTVELL